MQQRNEQLMTIEYEGIPMTNSYERKVLNVRDCYDTYYTYVDDILKGKDRPPIRSQN